MYSVNDLSELNQVEKELVTLYPSLKQCIVIFGSARASMQQACYESAEKLSMRLAELGYSVATGGGFGVMEAANKGVKKGGGISVGLTIDLPHERPNNFLDIHIHFEEFWIRKYFFERLGKAFIVCAGGFGTLDELFEMLVLIQTNKRKVRPILLYGSEFWLPMKHFLEISLLQEGCINENDMQLFKIVDSVNEIEEFLTLI